MAQERCEAHCDWGEAGPFRPRYGGGEGKFLDLFVLMEKKNVGSFFIKRRRGDSEREKTRDHWLSF